MPDKVVPTKYISNFAATLYLMGIIEDYGDDYIRKHNADKIDVRSFSINDNDYADFVKMVMERDIPYKSESRIALERLRKALASERNTSLEESLEAIDRGLKDDKLSNLETFRKEIIESINTNIVLRYAYAEGVIANSLSGDEVINEAVALLSNPAEYKRITTSQDTARK